MNFVPKNTKKKENSIYKSLYIKEDLVKKVKLDVQYTISEETTSFTINKIKIKE